MDAESESGRLEKPFLWGFLSTLLMGIAGYLALMAGAWPLIELPVLTPAFAYVYMRRRLRTSAGFGRYLAGYAACLVLILLLGVLFVVTLE